MGERGDAGKPAQQIEHQPLGGQQVGRGALDPGDRLPRRGWLAIGDFGQPLQMRVDKLEDHFGAGHAGDDPRLACDDGRRAGGGWGDDGGCGDVACSAQVLA